MRRKRMVSESVGSIRVSKGGQTLSAQRVNGFDYISTLIDDGMRADKGA